MLVYRIETGSGEGPYVDKDDSLWHAESHNSNPRTPGPHDDGIGQAHNLEEYRYGFKSIADLKAWFLPQELVNLAKLDYSISVYKIDDSLVIHGRKQIAFEYDAAEYVETITLSDKPCTQLAA